MTKKITFPKVAGTNIWRNAETGVMIQHSAGNGLYNIFYTSPTDANGYWGTEKTLKEARELATERVETVREQVAADHAEALLIEGEMIAHRLDIIATEVDAPTAPRPARILWAAAARSLEAGFINVAAERLRKVMAILTDPSSVPSDAVAAAELATAPTSGQIVRWDDREATVDGQCFINAETNLVMVPLRFRNGNRYGYASRYLRDITISERVA